MSRTVWLNEVAPGQRARLVRIDGGRRLQRRLMALGLSIGQELDLLQHRDGGVVVARGSNRVALGEGIARKLQAELIDA